MVANWICDVIDDMGNETVVEDVKTKVLDLCQAYPVYGD
jgi:glycine hydroxymethyltransferase